MDVLTLNAGSSSLKFALFRANGGLRRLVSGAIQKIGQGQAELKVKPAEAEARQRSIAAQDHASCFDVVWDELRTAQPDANVAIVGHRIVHGGPRFFDPQLVTPELLAELRRLSPFDPQHLPSEIALMEAVRARCRDLPQLACFDTAFHRDLPRVARILPIPRRYEAAGIRRYGFHGLSYEFLLGELAPLGDTAAKTGRVILAHLGNGASLAAVLNGRCVDTSMGFTPSAGLVMGSRSGDLDPGLVEYLHVADKMDPSRFNTLVNRESGLRGISETSSDMRELLDREPSDPRAKEAVDVFCYQVRKWVGAYVAVLGGLDTLVFAGGIGENCPPVRQRICAGLHFLGVVHDEAANAINALRISAPESRVAVRVIPTDEEQVIARAAVHLLQAGDAAHPP